MRFPVLARCLLGVSFLFLATLPVRAQAPPEDYRLRVEVPLVNVDVAVTDAAGNFIANLKPQNFRLREDGVPQAVTHFAPTQAPVRIVLLVESSPAVFLIRGEHLLAAQQLLRRLRLEDEVALVSYAQEAHREADFTRDKQFVSDRLVLLGRFGLGMAEVNLLDAVADTLAWLSPPPQRTAVLVIATGLDSGSTVRWQELEQRVGASQVTFFTIATGRLIRGEAGGRKKRAQEQTSEVSAEFRAADARLRVLAEASAGQAYFPESAKDLDRIYAEIAERLRNLYSLGYAPSDAARDGRYHALTVELVDENGGPLVVRDAKGKVVTPRVFARPGYFAAQQ